MGRERYELLEENTNREQEQRIESQKPNNKPDKKKTTPQKEANVTYPSDKGRNQLRVKLSKAEYKEIIFCHYYTLEKTRTVNLKETLNLWTKRNPNSAYELNHNTMATERRSHTQPVKKRISEPLTPHRTHQKQKSCHPVKNMTKILN